MADQINAAIVGTTTSEVIVAFRGTLPIELEDWNVFVESVLDWANDGQAKLVGAAYTVGLVHQGFAHSLDLLWGDLLPAIKSQHASSKLPVVVTGHSKGGALAAGLGTIWGQLRRGATVTLTAGGPICHTATWTVCFA